MSGAATTCPAGTGPIPQIIHQSWRTHELPSTLRPLSASWSHLSGWRHRLWTDDENRALWAAKLTVFSLPPRPL